ncbi:MAG: hypothetical protein J4F47_06925 [Alphaproteobacteria bacterium]|nr:hypothetical protein [Alphaproteobacteria bacterium]
MGRLLADAEQQIGPALTAERHRFVWDFCGDTSRLLTTRRQAAERFFTDYSRGGGSGWYVCGELPRLPFATSSFDLALCSHLLFLYSRELGLEFHLHTLLELARVAAEVRVFPMISLDGTPHRTSRPTGTSWNEVVRGAPSNRFRSNSDGTPSIFFTPCGRRRPAGSPGPVRLLGADQPGVRRYKTAVSG